TVIPTWNSDRRSGASLCRGEKRLLNLGKRGRTAACGLAGLACGSRRFAAMPQIFHRSFNVISRVTIFGAVFILAGLGAILAIWVRSSYVTSVGVARVQPVPFSHEHHVNGLGIDCRYCHTAVETSSFAGIPPTKTCMNCHQQMWVGSDMLESVRGSYRT